MSDPPIDNGPDSVTAMGATIIEQQRKIREQAAEIDRLRKLLGQYGRILSAECDICGGLTICLRDDDMLCGCGAITDFITDVDSDPTDDLDADKTQRVATDTERLDWVLVNCLIEPCDCPSDSVLYLETRGTIDDRMTGCETLDTPADDDQIDAASETDQEAG